MLILTACPFKCQTYTIKWVPGAQIKKKQPLSDDVDIRDVLPSIFLREYLTEKKKKKKRISVRVRVHDWHNDGVFIKATKSLKIVVLTCYLSHSPKIHR